MLSRLRKWLLPALCCTTLACSHQRGSHGAPATQACLAGATACRKAVEGACQSSPAPRRPSVAAKPEPILPPDYIPDPKNTKTAPVLAFPSPRRLDPSVGTAEPLIAVPKVEAPDNVKPVTVKPPPAPLPPELSRELLGAPIRAARYEHALDFSYVVGELQYLQGRRQWRLRYAPHDQDDAYGGVVTLRGVDHLIGDLKPGRTARVHGQLVDPDARRPSPMYQAFEIKAVD